MNYLTSIPSISYNYPLENYSGSTGSIPSLYSESTSSSDGALVPYSGESIASLPVTPADSSKDLPIEEDGSPLEEEDSYLLIPTGVRKVSIPSSIAISPGPQTQQGIGETLQICDPSDQQKIILEVSKKALKDLQADPIVKYIIPIGVGLGYTIGVVPTLCLGTAYFAKSIYQTRQMTYKSIQEKTATILVQKLAEESQKLATDGIVPITMQQASKNFRKLQVEFHPDKRHDDPSATEQSQKITAAYGTFKTLNNYSYHLT